MEIIVASTMNLMMMFLIIMAIMGLVIGVLLIRILSLTIMPRMYAKNVVNVLIL